MKYFLSLAALATLLSGCGSSSSSSSAPAPFPSVTIDANPSAVASHSGLYDLVVTNGSNVTTAPSQAIRNLTMSNSTLSMGNTSTISGTITLTNSTLHVPTSWTGAGVTVHKDAGSSIIADITVALPHSDG
jgi:hypothetical protein